MTDFDDVSRLLAAARERERQGQTALFRATEARKRVDTDAAKLNRHFDEASAADRAMAEALERRASGLDATIEDLREEVAQDSRVIGELTAQFLPFTDPRERVGERRPDVPFLMFPLRLETRFKKVAASDGDEADELWVRVYPDDCLVDTFEETPAEQELLATEKFWVDWVAAGGDDALRRGAWKGFASTSGHGRAAWLLEQHSPAADAVFPGRTDPTDVILVVSTQPPVPELEKAAVGDFWAATWRAGDDIAAQQVAVTALEGALGADRANEVRESTVPRNLSFTPAPGVDRTTVRVEVAFLELPDLSTADAQRMAWSHAPHVRVLPERLVLQAYRDDTLVVEELGNPIPIPLVVGLDPLASAADQVTSEDGEIALSEPMRWIADFDEAVRIGMGFRIPISAAAAAAGFDELIVVGVRIGADEAAGKVLLEELFQHHRDGTAGFSVLPQGTATNNVEAAGSGFSESEDPDESFDLILGNPPALQREESWLTRPDGQWLAEMLGIDLATFDRTLHARGRDQCEARAMNTALWPATWGYVMETMLEPVFTAHTIEQTRWFFTNLVVGRGTVPAIRIADQPYGILPTTAFSRVAWTKDKGLSAPSVLAPPSGAADFIAGLERVLTIIRADWQPLVDGVPFVGGPGDSHQVLLDVVGLHGSSVEFHQRFAESIEQLTNRLRLDGFLGALIAALIRIDYLQNGMGVLSRLGYPGDEIPELLEKLFIDEAFKLLGEVIDDLPLSPTSPIRAYTDDGRNYITWLTDAARTSFDTLRKQEGFTDGKRPTALLYLMLRYALEQGYWDASLRLHEAAGTLSGTQLQVARLDPSFVHVASATPVTASAGAANGLTTSGKPVRFDQRSESRYEFLYRAERAITGDDGLLVADFIGPNVGELVGTRHLDSQLRALDELSGVPTARLERALAEHIDLCTYRLDAWRAGLLHYQLAAIRYGGEAGGGEGRDEGSDEQVRTGVYLGAFGRLTDVRSEGKVLSPVELPPDLDAVFNPAGQPAQPPLVRDDTNGGFIHAPSLNQATTAAILRNGYLANATRDNPDSLKVNLSSERVRAALGVIEGIRAGQKLGALLGYQLERGLHDRHQEAEVDVFIYELRKAFPLVADKMTDTVSEDDDEITLVEARNVVDGFALVTHVNDTGATAYPFGKPLPPASSAQATVINAEVDRIRDVNDAVADLALAEGVYQTVLGNVDRVASTLDAYSHGNFPPEPAVVASPRSGRHLTHRVGLHLEPGLDPTVSPNAVPVTPRSQAEPAVNTWLARHLPAPELVFCTASYVDAVDGATKTVDVTQADLGLQPIDLLYALNPQADQAMTGLDDLVVRHMLATTAARWDTAIRIDHTARDAGRFCLFEVGALVQPLRSLLLASRPLTPVDVSLPNETSSDQEQAVFFDPARLTDPLAQLSGLATAPGGGDDLHTLSADVGAWLVDPILHRADILGAIDGWLERVFALFSAAGFFAVQGTGTGFGHEWKGRQFSRLLELVNVVVDRWQSRLDAHIDLVDVQLPIAATDEERFALLRRAEAEIATVATVPVPATVAAYVAVLQPLRLAFETKLDELHALVTDPGTADLSTLLQRIAATQPLAAFESTGLDVSAVEDEVIRFATDLMTHVDLLIAAIDDRAVATQSMVTAAAATSGRAAAQLLADAAKALLGDDFTIIPEFELSPTQAAEWSKAYADRDDLLSYLTAAAPGGLGVDRPVDDWLYGVARVREPVRAWEQVTMLTGAFRTPEPALTPIQLPYHPDDRWLGLDHPADYAFDGERLLYTAHYSTPFDSTARQCGLLLDEWTEVIPNRRETTGLTFHYDRPNAEPPQVMLLVTSPQLSNPWRWDDLVDGVREAFAEAKLRAVEPTQVDRTRYATLLPATLSAVTQHPITIVLNLALNNHVATLLEADDG